MRAFVDRPRPRVGAHVLVPLLAIAGAVAMRSPWGKRQPDDATPDDTTPDESGSTPVAESPDGAVIADSADGADGVDALEIATATEFSVTAELQVFAHSLIADLFGAGLRVQNLMSTAPDELCDELEGIADHIDHAIRDIREFAFTHRTT